MKSFGRCIGLLFAFTVMMLVYVHQQVDIIQCSYRINDQQYELKRLTEMEKKYKFELASLKSPLSVEQKLAEADVELVLPKDVGFLHAPVRPNMPAMAFVSKAQEKDGFFKMLGFGQIAEADETSEYPSN